LVWIYNRVHLRCRFMYFSEFTSVYTHKVSAYINTHIYICWWIVSWQFPTHCNTLQHTATHCNTLQHSATHCNTLQHSATLCTTIQHTAAHCKTLQHTATHCNTLQHTATLCNILQHTAPHCNTLQHIATQWYMCLYMHIHIFVWIYIRCSLYDMCLFVCLLGKGLNLHQCTLQHTATHCNTLWIYISVQWCRNKSTLVYTYNVDSYIGLNLHQCIVI